jgi:hypothetical protein
MLTWMCESPQVLPVDSFHLQMHDQAGFTMAPTLAQLEQPWGGLGEFRTVTA